MQPEEVLAGFGTGLGPVQPSEALRGAVLRPRTHTARGIFVGVVHGLPGPTWSVEALVGQCSGPLGPMRPEEALAGQGSDLGP